MKLTTMALVVLCFISSSLFAQPARSGAEPGVLERLTGPLDMVNKGQTIVVKLALDSGERWFRVETSNLAPVPRSVSARSAEVFFWRGNLLLLVPREKTAFHFSVPDLPPATVLNPTPEGLGPVRDASSLAALLAGYEVTRIDTVVELVSAAGPRARLVIEKTAPEAKYFTQPPNPGGGPGSCGTSCEITCGDLSHCSVTCTSPRCASCTCPASCSCSF